MVLEITSPQNERIKRVVQLFSSRGRKRQQRMIVVGEREVSRCFQAGWAVESVFFLDGVDITSWQESWTPANWFRVSREAFEKLEYGDRNCQVVAVVERPVLSLDGMKSGAHDFLLVLEAVEKPGNIGAVFRSADGAGVDGVVLASPQTDLFHPNSIRASMGAVFSVPSAVADSEAVFSWLTEHQFQVISARLDASEHYFDFDLTRKTAVVLGSESQGVSPIWDHSSVAGLFLPMQGIADSLNVSVTAAVVAYERYRQRAR